MDWSEEPAACGEEGSGKVITTCLRMLWVDGHDPEACMQSYGADSWKDPECCAEKGMGSCADDYVYFEGEKGCHYGGDNPIYYSYCSKICEGKQLFGCGMPVVNRLFGFEKGDQRVNPEYHVYMEAFWMKYGAEMMAEAEANGEGTAAGM